jgi:hypothetical protein
VKVIDNLRHFRWPRRTLFALGLFVALAILLRILLDPIAAHFTRKRLNDPAVIIGDFLRVHVTLFPPGYEVRRLKVIEAQGGDWRHPLFYARLARVTLEWRRLFHAEIDARLHLDEPKIVLTVRPAQAGKVAQPKTGVQDVGASLEKLIPVWVNRVETHEGEFLLRDLITPRRPEIWVHHIELAAESLATRKRVGRGRLTTVSARATLGHSGGVTLVASVDRFATEAEFTGDIAIHGWKVAELYDLEEPATKLQTPAGTLDLFAKLKARGGAISGWVKPVLKNFEVRPTEEGFGNRLKAWVADKGLLLLSDRGPEGNSLSIVIPIEGRLDTLDGHLWPTIMGIVRNGFVEGITSGFAHLPVQPGNGKK